MPTAEDLFERVFLPLYPPGISLENARREDANPAENPTIVAHLADAAARFAALAPSLLGDDVDCDFSPASVHRIGAKLTRARRDVWLAEASVGTADSTLFNLVVHGAAYVGEVAVRTYDARWKVRRPLWESLLAIESRAGEAELSPFSWWIRSLGDQEIERFLLGDRFRAFVAAPSEDPAALAPIAPVDRRLPKLAKNVRYDVLFKHLKAHLPELSDLGRDFPSPERFAEYKFKSLDFTLLEGGRVLVMHGPGEGGLHLFWLTSRGFEKALFLPCDGFPSPLVQARTRASTRGPVEVLSLIFAADGQNRTHEVLAWGA